MTTPVRASIQTGNPQPRADPASGATPARSAAFERSSVGLRAEVGGCGPSEPRAHARGHIKGASSLRVRGSRDRNGQQNRDDLEPTARPSFHHPRVGLNGRGIEPPRYRRNRVSIPSEVVLKFAFLTPPDQIAARYSLGCDCRSCLASTLRPVGVSIFSASSFSSRCSASCRTARANP